MTENGKVDHLNFDDVVREAGFDPDDLDKMHEQVRKEREDQEIVNQCIQEVTQILLKYRCGLVPVFEIRGQQMSSTVDIVKLRDKVESD